MEALRALIVGALAPAGYPIVTRGSANAEPISVEGLHPHYYDSGTSALAAALAEVRSKRGDVQQPKVIIPGYCCPDLISAAVFAGLQPVAVDISSDDPGYDPELLAQAIDANTVAIIAVNFLGIAERLTAIKALSVAHNVALIEDNAQWLPTQKHNSVADYVVFSFGRGKPLSLLGGGVLFSANVSAGHGDTNVRSGLGVAYRLKLAVYNLLLRPFGYGLVSRLKFLRLGRTVYKPKIQLLPMELERLSLLNINLPAYRARSRAAEVEFFNVVKQLGWAPFPILEQERVGHLLRFPLLCRSKAERDALLVQLAGLGASPMYAASIDCVEGVGGLLEVAEPIVNAKCFAERLLTLPVHCYVKGAYLQRILSILEATYSQSK